MMVSVPKRSSFLSILQGDRVGPELTPTAESVQSRELYMWLLHLVR